MVAYCIYILWAITFDSVLDQIGISYYPSKEWAIILPIWILLLIPLCVLVFIGWNLWNTPSEYALETITDSFAIPLTVVDPQKLLHSIPELQDVSPVLLSRMLYTKEYPQKSNSTLGLGIYKKNEIEK